MLRLNELDVVQKFAIGVVEGIRQNIRTKQATPFGAVDDTGKAADSLFYRIEDDRIIIGSTWEFIFVLEDGRKPGKFAPPDVIEKWVESKPVRSDINPKSLAFLINRKLKNEGSLIYRQGGHSGVISEPISPENISNNLTKPLIQQMVDEITGLLFNKAS